MKKVVTLLAVAGLAMGHVDDFGDDFLALNMRGRNMTHTPKPLIKPGSEKVHEPRHPKLGLHDKEHHGIHEHRPHHEIHRQRVDGPTHTHPKHPSDHHGPNHHKTGLDKKSSQEHFNLADHPQKPHGLRIPPHGIPKRPERHERHEKHEKLEAPKTLAADDDEFFAFDDFADEALFADEIINADDDELFVNDAILADDDEFFVDNAVFADDDEFFVDNAVYADDDELFAFDNFADDALFVDEVINADDDEFFVNDAIYADDEFVAQRPNSTIHSKPGPCIPPKQPKQHTIEELYKMVQEIRHEMNLQKKN